jgi:hypothetical protein
MSRTVKLMAVIMHVFNRVASVYTRGTVVVVIVLWLDVQLPMQSVAITTNIVSSNLAQARCTRYNIMW